MSTTVKSVIAAINERRPGLTPAKQHLLLFFCQGHHLADVSEPLFAEPLYATDGGIDFEHTVGDSAPLPANPELNTIGYVVARYGALSHADLRTLVQASQPWEFAAKPGTDSRIEWAWLRDWFGRPDEIDDPHDERPSRAEVAEVEAYLASRRQP